MWSFFILHTRHLQISPEILEKVFYAWHEQVANTFGRQDIQAARIMIARVIIKIELGYDEVHILYRCPLGAGQRKGNGKEILEAEPNERSLNDMDRASIQSIYELAPHLAEKQLLPGPPKPVNPRAVDIFRVHTKEIRCPMLATAGELTIFFRGYTGYNNIYSQEDESDNPPAHKKHTNSSYCNNDPEHPINLSYQLICRSFGSSSFDKCPFQYRSSVHHGHGCQAHDQEHNVTGCRPGH